MKVKALIIGAGQIGQAIYSIIKPHHEAKIRDVEAFPWEGVDFLHICYPDGPFFVKQTQGYLAQYKPRVAIIHSSVAIGKTDQCGDHVVHCPVRGRHPKLAQEIPAFRLYVAGRNEAETILAQTYLETCGLVVKRLDDPRATEACKLLSNVHMGLEIAWRQEVSRIFRRFGISESIYEEWEDSYNLGYRIIGDEQLTRPRLRADPIGGHCILQCTDILQAQYDARILDCIVDSNEKVKKSLIKNTPEDKALAPDLTHANA